MFLTRRGFVKWLTASILTFLLYPWIGEFNTTKVSALPSNPYTDHLRKGMVCLGEFNPTKGERWMIQSNWQHEIY
ncbi:hypothetical protein L1765_08355 [Microaerobacter geothermalis]|uniref:hypothetical protein n=1 Tax=Microaerobacter geothermalis TaxID=674972 RepID=UPI001F352A13|nr:hypothetical protein [Microaerobacter geothermalis]MCF6093980.1 hypothetical protein [Microaerobacter geothermalis]